MKILIVQNNQDHLMEFTETLENSGHSVLVIQSVRQGIALVNNDLSLDLIIISVTEDNHSSLSLLRHTKASQRLRWIPFIVASREWNTDMVRRCHQLGAEGLLSIPCPNDLLLAKISDLITNGKRVVLIVENDSAVMRLLRNMLEIERFRVICAVDAGEAMDTVMRKDPHLVLSEVMLPNRSGLLLLNAIKKKKPNLPVILIAGHDNGYREADIISSDADGFLSKPFKNTEIVSHIRKFVG